MALQDHFRPPLSVRRHWHAFHHAWATYIASDLNQLLPEGYFAEPNVQFGDIEAAMPLSADVGWAPPAPTQTVPFPLVIDTVEVLLYNSDAGPTLVGAIELVSPANKDRPAHRDAFVAKRETYLQQGMGLVVVDVVTGRRANLHDEFLARLRDVGASRLDTELYAVAYRPVQHDGEPHLDMWQETLAVGRSLPTMPLWLRGTLCLPVVLDRTYARTCRGQRIMVDGASSSGDPPEGFSNGEGL
jgi:hypothetical protein